MQKSKDLLEIEEMLNNWVEDQRNLKKAFLELLDEIITMDNLVISFKARPGISYSVRASIKKPGKMKRKMFTIIDIIDDPDKWLSVCFYDGTITDKEGLGNMIPQGILGEDGYCFDLDKYDSYLISYLKEKISESYDEVSANKKA